MPRKHWRPGRSRGRGGLALQPRRESTTSDAARTSRRRVEFGRSKGSSGCRRPDRAAGPARRARVARSSARAGCRLRRSCSSSPRASLATSSAPRRAPRAAAGSRAPAAAGRSTRGPASSRTVLRRAGRSAAGPGHASDGDRAPLQSRLRTGRSLPLRGPRTGNVALSPGAAHWAGRRNSCSWSADSCPFSRALFVWPVTDDEAQSPCPSVPQRARAAASVLESARFACRSISSRSERRSHGGCHVAASRAGVGGGGPATKRRSSVTAPSPSRPSSEVASRTAGSACRQSCVHCGSIP